MWGGWESMNPRLIANFNAKHDIQIRWIDNGWGIGDYYEKLMTAMYSGTGGPDVFICSLDLVPNLTIQDYLVDMGQYGAAADAGHYSSQAWDRVASGNHVYGIPGDLGPIAFFHWADRLNQAGINIPTTWDEYADSAENVRSADHDAYLGVIGQADWFRGLIAQAGGSFFSYDMADPTRLKITIDSDPANKVMRYWGELIKAGVVDTTAMYSTEMNGRLARNRYWGIINASWYSWQIESKVLASSKGQWRVSRPPAWTAGDLASGNIGGGCLSVAKHAKDPEAATFVCRNLLGDDTTAWDLALWTARLFPTRIEIRDSNEFESRPSDFYGGQKVNEVYIESNKNSTIPDFPPFSTYADDTFQQHIFDAIDGHLAWSDVMSATQEQVVNYAKEQRFNVL